MHIEEILIKLNVCFFFLKDEKFLEKFFRKKNLLEEFDSEPVYNGKYLKTKIKSYNGKVNTSFDNSKIPKEGSQCIYVSVILTYSVYRKDKNYYPQVFLEECKYVIK